MREELTVIGDTITLVANGQQAEATALVNDLLSARVLDSLQAHKETIAQSLFAPSADALSEEFESVEDFKKRGGTVKQIPAHKSYSAPKSQKIKVPYRMGSKAVKEETENLEETNWIAGAVKNKGGLHRALHVPQGEKIPASKIETASHEGGKIGKEANLAKTLKGFHK